jgi:hypothetical protein
MRKQPKFIVSVQITSETKAKLDILAKKMGISLSEVIRLKLNSSNERLEQLEDENQRLKEELGIKLIVQEKDIISGKRDTSLLQSYANKFRSSKVS